MSDEIELFDCIPQIKGPDGSDLGVASVSLRKNTFLAKGSNYSGDNYVRVVVDQSGSILTDIALIADSQSIAGDGHGDDREAFDGAYKAMVLGDTSTWQLSQTFERTLTLNGVELKLPTQNDATMLTLTVAAAIASLRPVIDQRLLVAQMLKQGRKFDDDDESDPQNAMEVSLATVSVSVFDPQSLEMVSSTAFTNGADDQPTARFTTGWLAEESPAQLPYLKSLFLREGNEVMIAVTGSVLMSQWNILYPLAGSEGGSSSRIYVIGVRVSSVSDAAEAQSKRLKARLQNTGATQMGGMGITAEAVRARSSSLRRSLPPEEDASRGEKKKDTSLSDEINKARASMKRVDDSEVASGRGRGDSVNHGNTNSAPSAPPPIAPKKVAAKPPTAPPPKQKAAVTSADNEVDTITSSSSAPIPMMKGASDANTNAFPSYDDDVRISPITAMHFNSGENTNTEFDASLDGALSPESVPTFKKKSSKNKLAQQGDEQEPEPVIPTVSASSNNDATVTATATAAGAGGDALYSPTEEEQQYPEGEGAEGGEGEEEPSYEEVVRLSNKLKKRKAKIEAAEVKVSEMENEIYRRSELMAAEQSELADERQRLDQLRAALEAQQFQLGQQQAQLAVYVPPASAATSINRNSTAAGGGADDHATISMREVPKNPRNMAASSSKKPRGEHQPLLPLGHADADGYVFRVEHEFYDSKDMPPGMLRRMPITCAFVKYTALCLPVSIAIVVGILGAVGLLAWRVKDDEDFVWPMLVAYAICAVVIGFHARCVPLIYDLYHAVDQSMHGNSGGADPHAAGYEWSPLTAAFMVCTVLCTFGSAGLIAFDDVSIAARAGVTIGAALCALGIGSILSNLSLVTHVLWYRIASTVPRQHGSLFTRVSIRAAAARYQYAKQLVELGSRRFSPTVLMLAATSLLCASFAPYYMFMINNTHHGHLAGAIGYTAAITVLFALVVLLSSWEGATRQVIGNMGVQADRWVRGDYNNESDARLEDYVAAQSLLVNHLLSGEYAKWTIDFVPFLSESRSDVVPADFRTVVIGWPYRLVSFLLLILGIVIIPVIASSKVGDL